MDMRTCENIWIRSISTLPLLKIAVKSLADIESRVAEIFLSKLNEGKQVITAEDVNSLITTMGSVNDFKAAEEQEFKQAEQPSASTSSQQSYSDSTSGQGEKKFASSRQLLRDEQRKILGGVCSGMAHLF